MAERSGRKDRCRERQCAVTRLRGNPEDFLRFAAGPDEVVVPDLKACLPGRGVWIGCAHDIVAEAVSSGMFSRALKRSVKAPEDLVRQVDRLLERAALQRLSLANKAGLVICGFDKVSQTIRAGETTLLHAEDAAADGCRKLDRLQAGISGGSNEGPSAIRLFNAEQLSLALGRPNVVHAAVKQGGPSRKFLESVARLARFRAGSAINAAA
ncbi:MAG: RNA-binding protein [Hyphomicrobiaceae bacterium]|nr:RNA-binding protein [Hyphomicrobiaceae bacterium]